VVDLVELRRQQALGPRGPFIYFNLVVVVVLPSLASHRFGNPFCIQLDREDILPQQQQEYRLPSSG